ncbi:MAG: HNH endonuclease signature motif containing protein, partial [Gammaproteobacteria bacterium]|nr:HNH endonuclease signature motif containing protein [Gammaproteobacteria bacterium]
DLILVPYNDAKNKRRLYGEQAGDCAGCGMHFELRILEIDHTIPRAKGGTDHLDNLQLLCSHCNRVKGDRGMEYLKAKLQLAA